MAKTNLTPYPYDPVVWAKVKSLLCGEWPDSMHAVMAQKVCTGIYARALSSPRIHDGTLVMSRRAELTAVALLMDVCEDDAHYELFMKIARCVPGCLS